MPYKSDKQRKWAHTESAEKAGFPTEEFDKASKGKKMADGGMIEEKEVSYTPPAPMGQKSEMEESDMPQGWEDQIMNFLKDKFDKPVEGFGSTLGTDTTGLQGIMNRKAGIMPQEEPQGYAQGGMPGLDDQMNPSPAFNPQTGMPPMPPQMPVQAQSAAPAPDMTAYLDTQRQSLNKYGPEQQMALQNQLQQKYGGLQGRGSVALGGLADAIMQGVGRTGSPGFMGQIQGQQNTDINRQLEGMKGAREANIQNVEQNQKLDAMDPNSQVSKVAQQTWGALLSRSGFKPTQIALMPASSIAALTGQTVEALKAEAEAKMAAATLGLKTQEAAQTAKHQTAEEETATERERLDAAGKLAGRGMFKKATDAIFGDPGTEALEAKLKGGAAPSSQVPEVTNQQAYDSLPAGALYTHNGIQHRKK